jgi:hypothetical protein
MSSFTRVLLEEGVEVELPTNLSEIIGILDKEVPYFTCEGHGYSVIPGKGTLGRRWDLVVKHFDYEDRKTLPSSLGRVELETLDRNHVQLRVPPRAEQEINYSPEGDPDGRFFGAFVYQTLNVLQQHKLLDLPGVLPTV